MQPSSGVLKFFSVVLLVGRPRSFVDGAVLPLHPNSADDLQSAFKNSGLKPASPSMDEDVRELHSLRPLTDNRISLEKSSSGLYTDIDGHKESHVENKQEVNKNGQNVGSLEVVVDTKDVPQSATPATHVHAELNVPGQGLHRTFDSAPASPTSHGKTDMVDRTFDTANKRKALGPRPDPKENMVDGYHLYSRDQYSPLDMAEYVFWTGDEKGITMAIEEFLQDGLMTREEAIAFLQDIKMNLDYLQSHYADDRFQRQELARDRANQIQKALKFDKLSVPTELSEVRQLMKENLMKKSAETEEIFSPTMGRMGTSLTDDDYQELLERLRMADFLYTEYSLEEVIYQLAKVMFSQSLVRGSSEAQEALQKFTGFLETEAENGRISHGLEKKILDVLVTSLTDTLSEHPELVSTARAGLTQSRSPDTQHAAGHDVSTRRFHGPTMKKTAPNP